MTRRDLFKALGLSGGGLIATAQSINGEPLRMMPYANHDRRKEEYHYAQVEFSLPRVAHLDTDRLEAALIGELREMEEHMRPMAQILAEDGQAVWHAGWRDHDGYLWRRQEDKDVVRATLAVYSRHSDKADVAYNRARVMRAIYDPNVRYKLIQAHDGFRKVHNAR